MPAIFTTSLVLTLASLLALSLPGSVYAQDPARISDLEAVFSSFLSAILSLAAVASLVMLLMGGLKFLTAGSNKEAATRAWGTITYAIAGLILSLSAWIIIDLLGDFLGFSFGTFNICVTSPC